MAIEPDVSPESSVETTSELMFDGLIRLIKRGITKPIYFMVSEK
jgi:hypothetical protein